jgi:hypothetical protein
VVKKPVRMCLEVVREHSSLSHGLLLPTRESPHAGNLL